MCDYPQIAGLHDDIQPIQKVPKMDWRSSKLNRPPKARNNSCPRMLGMIMRRIINALDLGCACK